MAGGNAPLQHAVDMQVHVAAIYSITLIINNLTLKVNMQQKNACCSEKRCKFALLCLLYRYMLYTPQSHNDNTQLPNDGSCEGRITYRDQLYPPDVDLLHRMMMEHRVPYAEQYALWLDFYEQHQDLDFGYACLERAKGISDIIEARRAMPDPKTLHVQTACREKWGCKPSSPYAQQHFQYNNSNSGYQIDYLCESLRRMSQHNLLPSDHNNLDNARMAFEAYHNVQEAKQQHCWVRWNGKLNGLHYLIDLLIEHNIISSGTRSNERWIIACGTFVDSHGNLIDPSRLSNSNQLSDKSRLLINHCMVGMYLASC